MGGGAAAAEGAAAQRPGQRTANDHQRQVREEEEEEGRASRGKDWCLFFHSNTCRGDFVFYADRLVCPRVVGP